MTTPAGLSAVAGGSTQLALAETARGVQLTLRAQLMADVAKLWPMLDAKRLPATFPGWVQAMMLITRNYHGQSAEAAARFYQAARADAVDAPTPRSLIQFAVAPGDPWMRAAFGYAGPGMLSRDTARPNTALTTTLGTATRIALDGGRTTVMDTALHDKIAVGWYRVTGNDPCAFCALLSSRGVVYRSEKSGGFEAHNHCGCSAAPAFSHNQELPAANQLAQDVYYDASRDLKGSRTQANLLPAFRKAWDARDKSAA